MPLRMSGLVSQMDTQSIIQELVAAKRTKVDAAKKSQTMLGWRQEAWKNLNSKIYKLFNGSMSKLNLYDAYAKRTTDVSNTSAVSVITSDSAMKSTQTLKILKLAQSGFLTGGNVQSTDGSKITAASKAVDALGITSGSSFEISSNGNTKDITVNNSTTVGDIVSQLKAAGVDANFDEKNQRFYISSSDSGLANDFSLTASNGTGADALNKLGILIFDSATMSKYTEYAAMDTNAAAKQAAIDNNVASRLKGYKTQLTALNKTLDSTKKSRRTMEDDFRAAYQEELSSVNKQDLQDEIDALKNRDDLTAAEKADLKKLEAKMTYVDAYAKNGKTILDTETKIQNIGTYMNADGTATSDLVTDVTNKLNSKITEALSVVNNSSNTGSNGANKIAAQDAVIELNRATYTNSSNTFNINGLTISCLNDNNQQEITLTTRDDTSGIYDMIKGFITEYSALVNEFDKLYNASTAKGYEPLTDEEKDAMSESEVEKWEEKIKDSLLRRDETLSTVSSAMKMIMSSGFTVSGKTMYLSDFGIETMGYFNAADNEKNAYHINGDKDDAMVSSKTNDLMAMISSDPDGVADFFTQLSKSMTGKMNELMRGSEYSSTYCVYEDKKMKEDYDDYTTKIKELEDKLKDYEDKWYSKFAAMETALSKLQSNANAVTSLLGG